MFLNYIFNKLCISRQYEERELRTQQERAKKRMEFDSQIDRITSNLEFEKFRDTQSKYMKNSIKFVSLYFLIYFFFSSENVLRWERTVQDADDALDASRQAEIKQRDEIDRELKKAEELKSKRQAKRHQIEQMDEDIGKVRYFDVIEDFLC